MSVEYVKHLAIAVKDVDAALAQYQKFLGIGMDSKPRDLLKGGSREAHFVMGNVEIQLCQSVAAKPPLRRLHRANTAKGSTTPAWPSPTSMSRSRWPWPPARS